MSTQAPASGPTADLGDLLPVVAHDLRAPLASVVGYIDLALDVPGDQLDAQARRYISIARREAERALRLAEDLLTLDAVEHGVSLELVAVDLGALVLAAVEAAQPRAAARRVNLSADLEVPAHVMGDRRRLAQVIDNLLSNALTFTPAGGEVIVSAGRGADGGWLAVRDSGPGIPAELSGRLFDRFTRGGAPAGGHTGGAGLGLAIVQAIVDAHHGRVWVESAEQLGSIFVVEGLRPAARTGQRTVLLVEDGVLMRKVAERFLKDAGYSVLPAASPAEALEVSALYAGEIDVVVSDLVLPEMDGFQLLRRICATRPGIHPVLCSSARPGDDLLESLGAVFVAKPLTPGSLTAAVEAAVRVPAPARPATVAA